SGQPTGTKRTRAPREKTRTLASDSECYGALDGTFTAANFISGCGQPLFQRPFTVTAAAARKTQRQRRPQRAARPTRSSEEAPSHSRARRPCHGSFVARTF